MNEGSGTVSLVSFSELVLEQSNQNDSLFLSFITQIYNDAFSEIFSTSVAI